MIDDDRTRRLTTVILVEQFEEASAPSGHIAVHDVRRALHVFVLNSSSSRRC